MEDIDGGLHPAVDGQSLDEDEDEVQKVPKRHPKPLAVIYSSRWQNDKTEKEGTTWIRKATDRRQWKTLMEGYILQWMDKA